MERDSENTAQLVLLCPRALCVQPNIQSLLDSPFLYVRPTVYRCLCLCLSHSLGAKLRETSKKFHVIQFSSSALVFLLRPRSVRSRAFTLVDLGKEAQAEDREKAERVGDMR